jgi:glutamate-1-semialdehyde 2,1-aminomutase
VDDPAIEQLRYGDLLTAPSPVMVELAERLTRLIDGMDWAVFAKNGTDMTTLAVSIARVKTGKKKIIMAGGAYHGSANWCSSNDFPELEDKKNNLYFEYNDVRELTDLFSRYRGEIAGILLTPYHHPAWADSVMPAEGFYPAVERLCREENALLIMDDIRTNFRLDIHGSHSHVGCTPDLITMGKSMANGYPIAVLMGTEEQRKAAGSFFITGTFWYSVVPMVAAMKALEEMERMDVIGHMNRVGSMLGEGLISLGKDYGFDISVTGVPAIPFMTFRDDPDLFSNQIFCSEMTKRGIYLHPHHNWFLSYAHKEEHIQQTLEKAKTAFQEAEKAREIKS